VKVENPKSEDSVFKPSAFVRIYFLFKLCGKIEGREGSNVALIFVLKSMPENPDLNFSVCQVYRVNFYFFPLPWYVLPKVSRSLPAGTATKLT
jgi:hypothetical protein